jgi:hypothetical protein
MKATINFSIEDLRALAIAADSIVYRPDISDMEKQSAEYHIRNLSIRLQDRDYQEEE